MGSGTSYNRPDLPLKNGVVNLDGDTDQFVRLNVIDDGTPTATWPNRFEIWLGAVLVGWLNEFGEIRWIGSAPNRVAARLTARNLPTDPARTANMLEFRDDQVNQRTLFAVGPAGDLTGLKGFGPWTTIPLDPTFAVASGGGYRAPEVRSAPGDVLELRGRMSSVGAWVANVSVIGTLPALDADGRTLRPTAIAQLLIRASSTMANLIVNTDGTIVSAQAVAGASNASIEGLRLSK